MMQKIMIATDGSDAGNSAAVAGIDIANRSGGSVIAIYVMDISRLSHLPGYATLPGLKEKIMGLIQEEGRQAIQFAKDRAQTESVPFHGIVAQGNPSEELLKASLEHGADLIIMGSLGRTAIEKFLLGSVAEKVVFRSTIPVLLVKGEVVP